MMRSHRFLSEEEINEIEFNVENNIDVDWGIISNNYLLTEPFILKFYDYLGGYLDNIFYYRIKYGKPISINFAVELLDFVTSQNKTFYSWYYFLDTFEFTSEQILRYCNSIHTYSDIYYVYRHQKLSEETILLLPDWRCWICTICRFQKLSWKFIEEYQEIMSFEDLTVNPYLNDSCRLKVKEIFNNKNDLSLLLLRSGIVGRSIE